MKRRPSIDQLCAGYHNENLHTEHVTRLALTLFDHVHRRLAIPRADRRLLKAASRLHDIAYSTDPAHHARAGARCLLRTGVAGFPQADCRVVAAVILLHQKRHENRLRSPLIRTLPQRRRALALAAILRVADGLDHEHIQNVAITSVRFIGGRFRIGLRGGLRNIPAAETKADLWRSTFPHDIVFGSRSSGARPASSHDSVLETARQLLCIHYRTVSDNIPGAIAARTPMPLHDIRVTIRRFCALLQTFRKPLERTSAARLANPFARLNSELGPIRDSDVWME